MRRTLFALPVFLTYLIPGVAEAQLVTCGGASIEGVIPCGTCEFVSTLNNVIGFLVAIASIIATIILVYAALRLVTSGGNDEAREFAKRIIWNIIIGLILVIAAYAIINVVIRTLVPSDSPLIAWQQVECIRPVTPRAQSPGVTSGYGTTSAANASVMPGDCSPENFQAQGATQSQAQTLSCISAAESGCDLNAQNPYSSARGALQITRGWRDDCHGLNLPECSAAVGVGGNLNCYNYFGRGGRVIPGQEAGANLCNQAASNFECNVAAGLCLLNGSASGVTGGYHHWTAGGAHPRQQACVDRFGN